MKKLEYNYFLSEEIKEKLKDLIGSQIFRIRAIKPSIVQLVSDEYLRSGISFNSHAIFSTKKNNLYTRWQIGSNPLGDTQIGYDIGSLKISPLNVSIDNKKWIDLENTTLRENKEQIISYNPQGIIRSIECYGYNCKELVRKDVNEIFSVNANVDMLLVFNTEKQSKIAIAGNGRVEGLYINYFPKGTENFFDDYVSRKENLFDEKLYSHKWIIE